MWGYCSSLHTRGTSTASFLCTQMCRKCPSHGKPECPFTGQISVATSTISLYVSRNITRFIFCPGKPSESRVRMCLPSNYFQDSPEGDMTSFCPRVPSPSCRFSQHYECRERSVTIPALFILIFGIKSIAMTVTQQLSAPFHVMQNTWPWTWRRFFYNVNLWASSWVGPLSSIL
jgi:hypothetical protein